MCIFLYNILRNYIVLSYVIGMKDTSNDFDRQMQRIFAITGARTQVELAALLDIRQAPIANSKKRRNVPDRWLVRLLCRLKVNPEWVLTGKGPRYLIAARDSEGREAMDIIRGLPTRVLVEEVLRRVHALERDIELLRGLGTDARPLPLARE